jgi:hypothetical protein
MLRERAPAEHSSFPDSLHSSARASLKRQWIEHIGPFHLLSVLLSPAVLPETFIAASRAFFAEASMLGVNKI